jgi:hypothetical protein
MPTKTIDVIAKIIRGDYVIKPVVCEPPAYLDQAIQDARAALAKAKRMKGEIGETKSNNNANNQPD